LHPVNALAYFGNDKLTPEHITGYEIGYKGVVNNVFFITADIYFNQLSDFITDLAVGVNPHLPFTQIIGGRNRTIWSYGNAGKVNEGGVELGLSYYFTDNWIVDFNTTYFKFEVLEKHDNDYLIPNTPEYKVNTGLKYIHNEGHSAEINYKFIPSYPWAAGIFRDNKINAYSIVSLSGTYLFSDMLQVNLNVQNVLDSKHYEILGGSLLGRRAIITVIVNL
jgi:outer membrane receptor protein involved in Fe transport